MVEKPYDKYFQKSKYFLYPLLGKPMNLYYPLQTYIISDNKPADYPYLFCQFFKEEDYKKKMYELIADPKCIHKIDNEDTYILTFDMSCWKNDWKVFVKGKYSKLSLSAKNRILGYYKRNSPEWNHFHIFLFPDFYKEHLANLYNVRKDLFVGNELCEIYDTQKESLVLL